MPKRTTKGDQPYTPPARSAESDRTLLNWLSMRVTDDGKHCHPDHIHERQDVERGLKLAAQLGLTVQPGAYLPPPKEDRPARRRTPKQPAA